MKLIEIMLRPALQTILRQEKRYYLEDTLLAGVALRVEWQYATAP